MRFVARATLRRVLHHNAFWCNTKVRKDIRDSRWASVLDRGRAPCCRPPPERDRLIAMQRCLLILLLCLSDVAVHGDFRFRQEVNETVEPTSIAALRSCGRHAVVPTVVLQTRIPFKNNSAEIYELKFIYTVYNAKFSFSEYLYAARNIFL